MGLNLDNKLIFIDTAPFIYYIENNKFYSKVLQDIFLNDSIFWITSVLTLTEILTLPYKLNRTDLVKIYKDFLFTSKNLQLIDIDREIAEQSSKIRASYNFKTPDSIQLACSVVSKPDVFLTNDTQLKKFQDISIMLLNDLI